MRRHRRGRRGDGEFILLAVPLFFQSERGFQWRPAQTFVLEGLFVELSVRSAKFQKGLKAAEASFKKWGANLMALGKAAFAMDAIKAAPLLLASKHAADAGSELVDMADRTGLAVETLSAVKFAAEQSGTTLEGLKTSIKKMQQGIANGDSVSARWAPTSPSSVR